MSNFPATPYRTTEQGLRLLPVNTIAKFDDATIPFTRMTDKTWQRGNNQYCFEELPAGHYLVLYIPDPPLPKVGAELTREDLDRLPNRAIVMDAAGDVAQVSTWGSGDNRSYYGPISVNEDEQSARDVWANASKPLRLFWLPETTI